MTMETTKTIKQFRYVGILLIPAVILMMYHICPIAIASNTTYACLRSPQANLDIQMVDGIPALCEL